MASKRKWIKGAIKNPGGLHRALHVPEGEKIPADKLAAARRSDNPRVRKMAALAGTLKKMKHGGKDKPRSEKWYAGK